MKSLFRALKTTIGQKYLMAITGLLLCGFLVAHLAGNLLLWVGPDAYNAYAHKLHENEGLLKVAEAGLLGLFLLHLVLALALTRRNESARRVSYDMKETKQQNRIGAVAPSNWMFTTGIIILGFLVLHLIDFTFEARTDINYDVEPFDKAVALMRTPITFWGYLIGCAILGVHLAHGFASAFQSLGANHPKYEPLINGFGVFFAVVIAGLFFVLPLWAMFAEPSRAVSGL